MMWTAVLWVLLVLLSQNTLVSSHILGRPSSSRDLAQIKGTRVVSSDPRRHRWRPLTLGNTGGNLRSQCTQVVTSDLQSLLQRFEETLAEAAQQEEPEPDYEAADQELENSQTSPGWSLDQEVDQEPLIPARSQSAVDGHSRTASQRSRLQDLLLTTRKRASSCFGARMDRIGNASGLGCNNGRG